MNSVQQIKQIINEIIESENQDLLNETIKMLDNIKLKQYQALPIPSYGDVFDIDYFFEHIAGGEGSWDYSDGKMIYPNAISIEERFTHIVYYSK